MEETVSFFAFSVAISIFLWQVSGLMGWYEFSWTGVGVSVVVSQLLYRLTDW